LDDWRSQAEIAQQYARATVTRMGRDECGLWRWNVLSAGGSLRLLPALDIPGKIRVWFGGGRKATGIERGPQDVPEFLLEF
jgi:hypothetical protein